MSEPLFSEPSTDPLASALHKLRWAHDGEFSVPLKPAECAALLDALEAPGVPVPVCHGIRMVEFKDEMGCFTIYCECGWAYDAGSESECYEEFGIHAGVIRATSQHAFDASDVVVSSSQTGLDAAKPGPH